MQQTKIILCGALGHMGQAVSKRAAQPDAPIRIVAGVDIRTDTSGAFPVYASFEDISENADVIVDFSHHSVLPALLRFATQKKMPAVICATGHTEEELDLLKESSKTIGIFRSGNMSLGINLLIKLAKAAAQILGSDYDIEIIEKHHNRKLDAPSGTALMIADAVSSTFETGKSYVYDRQSVREKRKPEQIGISSVRGGNIVGEHEIMFIGQEETVTISHSAMSRDLFADGAVKAAVFMCGKGPGLYDMNDLV